MQVFLERGFKDIDGEVIKAASGKPATLRGIIIEALVATFEDEKQLSGEDKLRRWELAIKVKNAPESMELSAEEISMIKKLVAKGFVTIVVGPAWQMLEGKESGL